MPRSHTAEMLAGHCKNLGVCFKMGLVQVGPIADRVGGTLPQILQMCIMYKKGSHQQTRNDEEFLKAGNKNTAD